MDRFVSPMPLPTAREREILTILIEECAEVQQRASKLIRFGRDEVQPNQPSTNAQRLGYEVGDLLSMIDMCSDLGLLGDVDLVAMRQKKREKVARYLQSKPDEKGMMTSPKPSASEAELAKAREIVEEWYAASRSTLDLPRVIASALAAQRAEHDAEIARLKQDASAVLQAAQDKLALYRAAHSGEYVGGMEYRMLAERISHAIAALAPQPADGGQ